jgi:hypothetical protein
VTNVTTLVSQPTGGGADLNNGDTYAGAISADGRYVLFGSTSDNMSDADNNAYESVHSRDLQASTTTLVSQPTGSPGCAACVGDSYTQSLSRDGRYARASSPMLRPRPRRSAVITVRSGKCDAGVAKPKPPGASRRSRARCGVVCAGSREADGTMRQPIRAGQWSVGR